MALSLSFPRWLPCNRGRRDWEWLGLCYWAPGLIPCWILCSFKAGTWMAGCAVVQWSNPSPLLGMSELFCCPLRSAVREHTLWFSSPFLRCFVQLEENDSGELLPSKGFSKPWRKTWWCLEEEETCLGLAVILAVGWVKTLAEFATSEVFASLGCTESFSCSLVWMPLALPANCKHLLSTGLTKMSPQKVLKIRRWKKSKRGGGKKKSQTKIQTSFDLSPVV